MHYEQVYCSVKPENLLKADDGRVRIGLLLLLRT